MADVIIGKGNLEGKGVYAARDFRRGGIVIKYALKRLTKKQYDALPASEKQFTHTHHGIIYLYSSPERYVNHSNVQNTTQDLENQCDIALRDIKKGDMITTDATKDDVS